MALIPTALPAAARAAIMTYAAQWNQAERQDIAFYGKQLRLLLPHRLYRYTGEQRAGKVDLGLVKPAGWRCFIRTTQGKLIMLDAFEAGAAFAFRLHVGNASAQWLATIRSARRRKLLNDGAYSMSTLAAPSAHLSCLWFRSRSGKNRFLGLERDEAGLTARKWMTRAECSTSIGEASKRTSTNPAPQS